VVKSEAYGHGMAAVAKAAEKEKRVAYLGVSTADEALELRSAGIRLPVLILSVVHPRQAGALIRSRISLTVSSTEEALAVNLAAKRLGVKAAVHAELDTGMGRLGTWYVDALSFLFRINSLPWIRLEGAYTHFPAADAQEEDFSKRQIKIFTMAAELFRQMYPRGLRYLHMANSAGVLRFPEAHFNLARPGIMAYGINPIDKRLRLRLKPVLSFKTRVILIKEVRKGVTISYGRTYSAGRDTRIAVLPVGYSYGYPYHLSNKARVLIRGQSYPVAGRVTMDHLMVDIGPHSPVRIWDEAVLIGSQGQERITAEDLAKQAGTISYEIVCSLNLKVPRVYYS